ncbi:MAG: hypothetical protein KJ709_08280 [Nanoarchaeota archaeon]|nr:hypothetical protein [Nanoarchaeota archaeon]
MRNMILLLVVLAVLPNVFGLSIAMPEQVVDDLQFVTSARQYYSVVFDGEGEAIVTLRLMIQNTEETDIGRVNVELPGEFITFFGVMQETSGYDKETCQEWTSGCVEYGQGQTCVEYDFEGECVKYERPCLNEGQVCSRYSTTRVNENVFRKIDVVPEQYSDSIVIPIELLSPIKSNGQTNILMMYKAEGFVDSTVGLHKFAFETAKLQYMTSNMRVAVNVQDGLRLKGTSARVNYEPSFGMFSKVMEAESLTADQARSVYSYSNNIMYQSGYVKTATYLDPHESFTVKGKYARSWGRLYLGSIVLWTLVGAAMIAFLVYGSRKIMGAHKGKVVSHSEKNRFIVPFLGGLFTAIIVALIWVVSIVIIYTISKAFGTPFFGLILVLFTIMITLAVMIGAPIFIGSKFGPATGVFIMLSMLGWLFLFSVIIFVTYSIMMRQVFIY